MTIAEFEESDGRSLNGALLALWWDARGDWAKAHEVAQDVESADGAWVHAYLHRKEGDMGNAAYWYRTADGQRRMWICVSNGSRLWGRCWRVRSTIKF